MSRRRLSALVFEKLESRRMLAGEFDAAVMHFGGPFNSWLFDFTRDPIVRMDRTFGLPSHRIAIAGDWDGNGSSDMGVIVPENGFLRWLLDTDGDPEAEHDFIYGFDTDIPVAGDWDNNGTWTPGVARPEADPFGTVFFRWLFDADFDSAAEQGDFIFGGPTFGDTPVAGDWNDDGLFDVGVARAEADAFGTVFYRWLFDTNRDPVVDGGDFLFGGPSFGHTPITGDWNGDGHTDAGAVGPDPVNNSFLHWYYDTNGDPTPEVDFVFGTTADVPVAGDWNLSELSVADAQGIVQSPVSVVLGSGEPGELPASKTFQIANVGTDTLTVFDVFVPAGFQRQGPPPTVGSGVIDTLTVSLDPTVPGFQSGSLTFATNDGSLGESVFEVQLTEASPAIVVSEARNGQTNVGTGLQGATIEKIVSIQNDGNARLDLGQPVRTGPFEVIDFPTSVSRGNSASFRIGVDTSTPGSKTGTLSFTSNDADESPYSFSLFAIVNGLPRINVVDGMGRDVCDTVPAGPVCTTDLGVVELGDSLTHRYFVQNTGDAPLTVQSPTVPEPFLIGAPSSRTFPATIQPGGSQHFFLTIEGTSVGPKSATVRILNDEGTGQHTEYDFQVQAIVVEPCIVAASHLVSFSTDQSLPGIEGTVDDADIVRVDVCDSGDTTFTTVFDASESGLPPSANVDGLTPMSDGFLLSMASSGSVGGIDYTSGTILRYSSSGWSEYGRDRLTGRSLWSNVGSIPNVDGITFGSGRLLLSIEEDDTLLPSHRFGQAPINVMDTDLISPERRTIDNNQGWFVVQSGTSCQLDAGNESHDVNAVSQGRFPIEISTRGSIDRGGAGVIENRDAFRCPSTVGFDGSMRQISGDIDGYERIPFDGLLPLQVSDVTFTSSGFEAQLINQQLDPSSVNLHSGDSAFGPTDIVLEGDVEGQISGSVVVDPESGVIRFIKSGSPLEPDIYTITLLSGPVGILALRGGPLDGDRDNVAGGDYVISESRDAPPANSRIVSLPDFVRGPGQDVNVPASSTSGLPLSLSDGTGVRNVSTEIHYDPSLLTITAATVGPTMPGGAQVTLDTSTPGTARLAFTSPTELPDGNHVLAHLQASVPSAEGSAIHRRQQILDIDNVSITDAEANAIGSIDDDAVHQVSYFADLSGNGRVNALDAARVAQYAALIVTGFSVTPLTDPLLLVDISGNGRVNASDASLVARFAARLPVPEIPALPGSVFAARGEGILGTGFNPNRPTPAIEKDGERGLTARVPLVQPPQSIAHHRAIDQMMAGLGEVLELPEPFDTVSLDQALVELAVEISVDTR